jgi:hypothetical protein
MKLTKKQALKLFIEIYAGPQGDVVWKREAWNNLTDSLCKGRQISSHQYNTWTNPF